jgi:hypothetical protein
MKRSRQTGILVGEEAITALNLQDIKIAHSAQVKIRDFTHHEEARFSGADWEWWFVDPAGAIGFAVQAKRLEKGRYDVAYKPDNHDLQINTLLRYCASAGDLSPLYCWYNYFPDVTDEIDFWGCALADGYAVYGRHLTKKYKQADMQPISTPWQHLVCNFDKYGIDHILDVAEHLASAPSPRLSAMPLPSGVRIVPPAVHRNGLPQRVVELLKSKGTGSKLVQKDRPLKYPGRLVVIERKWPKSRRFG